MGPALTAGCASHESAYARSVADYEPVYCYQSLAAVTCHARPNPRDATRLVNYYGPSPSRYAPVEPPPLAEPQAPKPVGPAVQDPEPAPSAAKAAPPPPAGTGDPGDWRYYLPFLTVLFGMAQVAAAFLF
jgi:hypothetical protein